jgi:hypothetical protein
MPLPFHALVPCAGCGCHVALKETVCPHCGAPTRTPDGAVPRTKVAVLMGLTAALLAPVGCGSDIERRDGSTSSSDGGTGGTGGDLNVGSAYGVGPSTGTGGDMNVGSAYGVGPSVGGGGVGAEGGFGGEGGTGSASGGSSAIGGEGGGG